MHLDLKGSQLMLKIILKIQAGSIGVYVACFASKFNFPLLSLDSYCHLPLSFLV